MLTGITKSGHSSFTSHGREGVPAYLKDIDMLEVTGVIHLVLQKKRHLKIMKKGYIMLLALMAPMLA